MDNNFGNRFKYFTSEDILFILKNKRMNTLNVWSEFHKLNKLEQEKVFTDQNTLLKLTDRINRIRTVKLIKLSMYLSEELESVPYIVDLKESLDKLQPREKEFLQLYFAYGYSQSEIESIMKKRDIKLSQQRIGTIINKSLDKLTAFLMDR